MIFTHLPFSLDSNRIADRGAGMLADALKVNQSLQNLRSATVSSITLGACMPCMPGYMPLYLVVYVIQYMQS